MESIRVFNMSWFDEFALCHPFLFLFGDLFQSLKKFLTRPSKVVGATENVNR